MIFSISKQAFIKVRKNSLFGKHRGKIKNAGRHMQYGGCESASLSASWRRQPTTGNKTHQTLVNSVDLLHADSNEYSLQSFELLQMIQDDESATPLLMEAPHKEKNKIG